MFSTRSIKERSGMLRGVRHTVSGNVGFNQPSFFYEKLSIICVS